MEEPPAVDSPEEAAPAPGFPTTPEPFTRRGIVVIDPPRLRRLDVLVLLAIMALIGGVHFARLAHPDRPLAATDDQCTKYTRLSKVCHEQIPLDEFHYLPDSRDVIRFGTESDTRVDPNDGAYVVHPPVGKWFIAAGIRIFGDSGFGWRFFGALLGVIGSFVIWLLARRLWGYVWLAHAAALLLGIEGLWFVMSRIAMLDIYMAFFVLCAVWLLLEDRARHGPGSTGRRWWRLGAGVSIGFALASKWAALPFVVVMLFVATWWAISDGTAVQRTPRKLFAVWGALVLLPVVVFLATYTPWFADSHRYNPPKCEHVHADWLASKGVEKALTGWVSHLGTFGQWVCYQKEVASFHSNLRTFNSKSETKTVTPNGTPTESVVTTEELGHPYFGNAWSWPWIGRPVAHYYETFGKDKNQRVYHIVGLPNPIIWWTAFFIGIPALAWWALFKRDRTASFVVAFILLGWAPYLYADATGRGVFFFYATPMVPFLVLAVVHMMARGIEWSRAMVWVWGAFVGLATLTFGYLYPVLAAYPLPQTGFWAWTHHMWLNAPHVRFFNRFIIPGDCTAAGNVVKHFCWI